MIDTNESRDGALACLLAGGEVTPRAQGVIWRWQNIFIFAIPQACLTIEKWRPINE
jgi:hypothetical protein